MAEVHLLLCFFIVYLYQFDNRFASCCLDFSLQVLILNMRFGYCKFNFKGHVCSLCKYEVRAEVPHSSDQNRNLIIVAILTGDSSQSLMKVLFFSLLLCTVLWKSVQSWFRSLIFVTIIHASYHQTKLNIRHREPE